MYVELRNISKSFGSRMVVDNLNLGLEKGKILCLLGASGCGKTTTLKMIGGFLEPLEGQIIVDGEDITALPPERRPVSTVFQSYALFPHKTVIENVIYGLKFSGVGKEDALKKGREFLRIVGLSDYAGARIGEISGGQQQRVALARALIVNPKVLLLDEPLSNLDAKLRVKMREEIRQLQQRLGMTMIFVTHDQEEAMVLADTVAIMHEGRLAQVGTPEQVYGCPADPFVMNFLGISNRVVTAKGREIYVRPEAIRIAGAQWEPAKGDEKEVFPVAGTIVKREFLGFYYQYQIRLPESIVTVREGVGRVYEPGDQVILLVDQSSALLTPGG